MKKKIFSFVLEWCVLCLVLTALVVGCAHKQAVFPKTALEEAINTYMGTAYRFGGASKDGMDCSGFVMASYSHIGVSLPHSADEQYRLGSKVDRDELRYGDVVFFNTKPWSGMSTCVAPCIFFNISVPMVYGVTHNGIYRGDGTFVHAREGRGVTVDRLDGSYWKDRYVGARRYLD